jgi:hypothetical protein
VTARQIRAQVANTVACAALPVAVLMLTGAVCMEVHGWLATPVAVVGGAVAVGAGVVRARWYRRGGAS